MTGRCGNDPRTVLTDHDRQVVEKFRAYLAARRAAEKAASEDVPTTPEES